MTISLSDAGVTFPDNSVQERAVRPVPVRQTVLSGPVDSNGFSSFGGSTGSTTVTATGTLIATAANGSDISGNIDRVGSITNPSWTGLSTNGTMYLGLTVNADGTCTPFSTTLQPTYQWGGTFSTTANQRTFNIQAMTMQVGNGSTAAQSYDVFVGEVTVAGAVVTAITWYALMGRYRSALQAVPAASSRTAFNTNIGIDPQQQTAQAYVRFLTSWNGYTAGMVVKCFSFHNNGGYILPLPSEVVETSNTTSVCVNNFIAAVGTSLSAQTNFTQIPAGSGTAQIFLTVQRNW